MATPTRRTVQKPGAATTTATPDLITPDTTTANAPENTAPDGTESPDLNDQAESGAYLPEQLADDERSELERLRTENAALKQQQAAAPATATQVTGPAPVPPAPPARTTHAGGGVLTEHGWLI